MGQGFLSTLLRESVLAYLHKSYNNHEWCGRIILQLDIFLRVPYNFIENPG
jgi:hypothetical protein